MLQGYSDVDGDELRVKDLTVDNGRLTNNQDGTWEFIPDNNFHGVVSINYFVDDGEGMKVFANNSLILEAVNDRPVQSDTRLSTSASGREDNSYRVSKLQLLTGFTDVDQDTLTIENLTIDKGIIQPLDDLNWEIQPENDFFGQIKLSYQVSDGSLSVDTIKSIEIDAVNDAPIATFITGQFGDEDGTRISGVLTSEDPDDNDSILYSTFGAPIEGLTINSDGSWEFNADGDSYQNLAFGETKTINVRYSATDSSGASDQNSFTITLTGTNDAPQATFEFDQYTTEGNQAIQGQLTSTDVDADDTATYTLMPSGIDPDQLEDAEPNIQTIAQALADSAIPGEIPGLSIASDGSWAFDPTQDIYQGLAAGQELVLKVNYQAIDSQGGTGDNHFFITVTGTNDAPVATFTETQVATEDAAAALVGQLTATDIDSNNLTFELIGAPIDGLTINPDGSWEFDTSDSAYQNLADGQTRDLKVMYNVTDDNGATNNNSFTITLTGTNDAPQATFEFDQYTTEGNQAIQGQLTSTDVDADDTATYTLMPSGIDPDQLEDAEPNIQTIAQALADSAIPGEIPGLSIASDGSWAFDPTQDIYQGLAAGQELVLKVNYQAIDSQGGTGDNHFFITVTGTNDAPVATFTETQVATEDAAEALVGQLTATDIDSNNLTFELIGAPIDGLTINPDGSWEFDTSDSAYQNLADGQTRDLKVMYNVTDDNGATNNNSFTITLTGTNDAPQATFEFDQYTTEGNQAIQGQLTSTDVDADDTATYTLMPSGIDPDQLEDAEPNIQTIAQALADSAIPGEIPGLSIASDGSWAFDPTQDIYQGLAAGQELVLKVNYQAIDSQGGTGDNHFFITVTGTNDAPVATFTETQVATEDAAEALVGQLTATDIDSNNLTFELIGAPIDGLTINPDGSWEFDTSDSAYQNLADGQTRDLKVMYNVTDDNGATNNNSFTITLTGTNDAPQATFEFDQYTTEGNQAIQGQLTSTDVDADDTATYTLMPSGIDPDQLEDAEPNIQTIAQALADSAIPGEIPGLSIASDGSWAFDPTQDIYQGLAAGQELVLKVNYQAIDSQGGTGDNHFFITVTGTNDAPVATFTETQVATEDAAEALVGQLTATDIDSNNLTFELIGAPIDGLTINPDGSWEFDTSDSAYQNLADGQTRDLKVMYNVTDDNGATNNNSFTITLTGTNDAPQATFEFDQYTTEGNQAIQGQLTSTDVDADDTATYTLMPSGIDPDQLEDAEPNIQTIAQALADSAIPGEIPGLSIASDGSWAFDPTQDIYQGLAAGQELVLKVNYQAIDSQGGTGDNHFFITVTGTNDAPVATFTETQVATEDAAEALVGQLTATDIDSNNLTFELIGAPIDGLTINPDGSWEFDTSDSAYQNLADGQTRDLKVMYNVTDDNGATNNNSFTITLTGTNDAPQATFEFDQYTTEGNQAIQGQLTSTDVDADDTATYTLMPSGIDPDQLEDAEPNIQTIAQALADSAIPGEIPGLSIASDGSWAFDPTQDIYQGLAAGQELVLKVNYQAIDSQGGTGDNHFFITVTGTNDAPVATFTETQVATEDAAEALVGQLTATDIDSNNLTFELIGAPIDGLTINPDGSWEFDTSDSAYQNLADGQTRDLKVMYNVTDDNGATNNNSFTITLTGTNDAPQATFEFDQYTTEGNQAIQGQLTSTDVDADDTATYTLMPSGIDPDQLEDAEPNIQTIAQALADSAIPGEIPGLSIASDGSWAFDPTQDIYQGLAAGQELVLKVNYQAIDSQGGTGDNHFFITVTGTNDAPVATFTETQVATEDAAEALVGQLTATDIDSNNLTFELIGAPIDGLTINPDGSWEFDTSDSAYQNLADGQTRDLKVMYNVTDDNGATNNNSFTITLTGTNDAPQATFEFDQYTTEGNQAIQGQLTSTDVDADDTATYTLMPSGIDPDQLEDAEPNIQTIAQALADSAIPGEIPGLSIASDGSWAFDPTQDIYQGLAAGQELVLKVNYQAIDSQGGTGDNHFFITVTGTNDAPELTGTKTSLALKQRLRAKRTMNILSQRRIYSVE